MLSSQKQQQDCFLPSHQQQQPNKQPCSETQDFEFYRLNLPAAKQLITHQRPNKMEARVFVTEPIYHKLPKHLNNPCIEINTQTNNNKIKPSLGNKDFIRIENYIIAKQLKLVYQKVNFQVKKISKQNSSQSNAPQDFTERMRNISMLNDYNQKIFRQLQVTESYQHLQNLQSSQVLNFDSKFETGNLNRVYINTQKNNKNFGAYFLLLQKDTNTHGYSNWFHFKASNWGQAKLHKFFIINIVKKTYLYKQGMKLSLFSNKKYMQGQIQWFKGGTNIHFFQSKFLRFPNSAQTFNCLYFQYYFQSGQEVYFAPNQPYSYTRLVNQLKNIQNQIISTNNGLSMKIEVLGHTLSNNVIPSIKISKQNFSNKKWILILGRQHPSQVAGSFICQYMMNFTTKQNTIMDCLLNQFGFIFVPMVNPDGVIYGNSRCNMAGLDLNRQWGTQLLKQLTPQTYKIKQSILNILQQKCQIQCVLDLHGHGKKLNSFFFCCPGNSRISNRIFPSIVSQLNSRFDLSSCTYGVSKDKQCTIRAQLYEFGIKNTYTLQNSYFGYFDKDLKRVVSYTEKDYQSIAYSLMEGIYISMMTKNAEKQKILQKYGFNIDTIKQRLWKQIDYLQRQQKNKIVQNDIMSDSDPQGDILKIEQRLSTIKNKRIATKLKQSYRVNNKNSKKKQQKNRKKSQKNKSRLNSKKKKQQNSQFNRQQNSELQSDSDIEIGLKQQRKLESKLVLSKRYRTQNKFKQKNNEKQQTDKNRRQQKKIVNKVISDPAVQLDQKKQLQQNRQFNNKTQICKYQFPKKTIRNYDRSKLFSHIKTQQAELKVNLAQEMVQQQARKQQIQKAFNSLKDESLKAMIKDSFSVLGFDLKVKRYKRIQSFKKKIQKQDINISKKSSSFSKQYSSQQKQYMEYREKKSHSMLLSKDKQGLQQQGIISKTYDKNKYRKSRMSKTNVLYHFPLLG